MAINKKALYLLFGLIVVVTAIIFVSLRVSQQTSITPNAPTSTPLACEEQCPGSDGVLRNCTGTQEQSLCAWQGRKESCGGREYCCPSENGAWTTDLTRCRPCTITGPTNLTTTSVSGTSQKLKWTSGQGGMTRVWVSKHANPTSNCSGGDGDRTLCIADDIRLENGEEEYIVTNLTPNTKYYWRLMTWKESGCDAGSQIFDFTTSNAVCTPTTWTPDPALTCIGTNVTQTSNCGTTRVASGTKNCSCTPTGVVTCSTNCNTSCGQAATTITNCTDSCGSPTTKQCPATGSCCSDTTWLPDANLTCTDAKITQTSNCGATRVVDGTKNCCVESTWSPANVSNTCSDRKVTQTSNCGTTREVDGTKTCYADLSVATRTYADDPRNTEGTYYTDKEITKVSRGQLMVYTIDIKNSGEGGAKKVVVTDVLTGQNQNLLSFVDSESKCKYNSATKKITCEIDSIPYKGAEKLKFRVRVGQTSLNGKIIRNTARVSYGSRSKEDTTETLVSSIVTCNEICTNDSECVAGLACDVLSGKCRKPTCISSTTCGCTTANANVTATKTPTTTPRATVTVLPDADEEDLPTVTATKTPTKTVTIIDEIDAGEQDGGNSLPASGIFDLPQGTIIGGGILLAIIGLFLAL